MVRAISRGGPVSEELRDRRPVSSFATKNDKIDLGHRTTSVVRCGRLTASLYPHEDSTAFQSRSAVIFSAPNMAPSYGSNRNLSAGSEARRRCGRATDRGDDAGANSRADEQELDTGRCRPGPLRTRSRVLCPEAVNDPHIPIPSRPSSSQRSRAVAREVQKGHLDTSVDGATMPDHNVAPWRLAVSWS